MACGGFPERFYVPTDIVTCSVCFDQFTDPKTLPCGHSLCLSPCLESLSCSPPMFCPLCREKIQMPPSGRVQDLPTNYVVKHLLEAAEPERARPSEEHKDGGEEREPVSWISTGSGNVCQTHDEECHFFCKTCTAVVCAKCLLSTHKVGQHDIVPMTEFAQEKIDSLIETLRKVQELNLEQFDDQRFSMKILQRMGRYYQKMPDFRKGLETLSLRQEELNVLCGSLVDDLCQNDFERIREVKRVPQLYAGMNKEFLRLDNLYNDICTDLKKLKVGMFAAAAAVGLSLGFPAFLPV